LHFGDLDDPQSNVARLLAENPHFTMHAELELGAAIFYLFDTPAVVRETAAAPREERGSVDALAPVLGGVS
jgi:hypothetical protein